MTSACRRDPGPLRGSRTAVGLSGPAEHPRVCGEDGGGAAYEEFGGGTPRGGGEDASGSTAFSPYSRYPLVPPSATIRLQQPLGSVAAQLMSVDPRPTTRFPDPNRCLT